MHPSSSNSNGNSSFTSNNQPKTLFSYNYNNNTNHSRPPQEQYYPPSSSSFLLHHPHFIPLEDAAIFHELFHQQQQPFSADHSYHNTMINVAQEHSTHETTTNVLSTMEKCSNNNEQIVIPDGDDDDDDDHFDDHVVPKSSSATKRSSKKDRHSKINTARGPRDRRMRLSLEVAKKFFMLQDMLGFDKASNTIEWLLTKSKPAIQELLPHPLNRNCCYMGVSNSASSTSEYDVLSGIDDPSMVKTRDNQATHKDKAKSSSSSSSKEKKNVARGVRKCALIHHSLAKETRERSRARARERTMEKRNSNLGCGDASGDHYLEFVPCLDQGMDQYVNRLGSWSPFEENHVQGTFQPEQPSTYFQFKQGIVGENSSVIAGNWSPPSMFNYQYNAGLYHENQFNDFEPIGKPWEGNSN